MTANASPAAPEMDPAQKAELRARMTGLLMARVDQDQERRAEALRDYLSVTQAVVEQGGAEALARMVPPLMPSLYRRWIGMFLERLFETATPEQLAVLADGSEENAAALALAFVMFLETERMERQMAEDLQAFGAAADLGGEEARMADLAASYLRARVATLAEKDAKKDAEKSSRQAALQAKSAGKAGKKAAKGGGTR